MKPYESKRILIEKLKTKKYFEIAKEFEVSTSTIQRKLRKFDLLQKKQKWAGWEIRLLKKYYGTEKNLGRRFPARTKASLYKMAFKIGLERPFKKRKYALNENFFKKWTKESSYFLGWMYSDGNVNKDLRTIQFHIHKKDLLIMKKLRRCIKSKQKIFIRGNHVEFRVHSKKICEDLVELGCMPKKAHKLCFPKRIPKKYYSHFVRGYFDGDGSIHFNKPNVIKIRIVGYDLFIRELKSKVEETAKIMSSNVKNWPGCSGIEFYGKNARDFCKWIYKGSGKLYLERKHTRYINHLNMRARMWAN